LLGTLNSGAASVMVSDPLFSADCPLETSKSKVDAPVVTPPCGAGL